MIHCFSATVRPWNGGFSEVEFFGEHGDHTRDLLLRVEMWVIGPRLEMPGHPVVHSGEDLQDLQAPSVLVEDGAEGLHKPGATPWVPPGVIAWDCGIGEEEVGLHWDLVSGIGVRVVDRARVGLDPVIELCPPARLNEEEFGFL